MSAPARGLRFERNCEQPAVWESIATGDRAERFARVLSERVVLVGADRSLFMTE